jgi:SMC interacting uncharacterized protein involved in chromosome segregation
MTRDVLTTMKQAVYSMNEKIGELTQQVSELEDDLATVEAQHELLTELAEYFDNHADISSSGGPNEAMTWHRRITDVLS